MASDSTELHLPPHFPYPIKVVSIDAPTNTQIKRGTRLISYSYSYQPVPELRFGTWDSAIEGSIDRWNVKPGDTITQQHAQDKPIAIVIEPCKHGIQLGGLCVLCGKDMTNVDYTGFSDASRASIQMTHSAFGPTVSFEEAQRIERETAEHLLNSCKLSLIVDLDQTIVHATVDPTVGEWIAEGEAWEEKRSLKAEKNQEKSKNAAKDDEGDDDDSDSSEDLGDDEEEECNPNWEALKDVKKFRLGPESFAPPSPRGPQRIKVKNKLIENEGCMYYIKPRPGWEDFLQSMAKKYEMHVYTMGTRAYAEQVCAAIDPDRTIFGGRILSRDESGSLTQKSLRRLFPCDTSMVVIIDDRADVWEWSPNLVKVVPYDFFVGIGDINSAFLPKPDPITSTIPTQPSLHEAKGSPTQIPTLTNNSADQKPAINPGVKDSPHPDFQSIVPTSPEDVELQEAVKDDMLVKNSIALEAQVEERPLAKKQEELQGETAKTSITITQTTISSSASPSVAVELPTPTKPIRKPLLKNDDYELDRIGRLLEEVHAQFFKEYNEHGKTLRRELKRGKKDITPTYDVTQIIPRMRSQVLSGVHILFSSVIPLDKAPETTEVWKMAHLFGATCHLDLTDEVTHVVANRRGTVKVQNAQKRGGSIKIVWLDWFMASVAFWRRQPEEPYLLDDPPTKPTLASGVAGSSPGTPDDDGDAEQISSDPDPDGDDWDQPKDAASNGIKMASKKPDDDAELDSAGLDLQDIDWNDINDEVEAAMNESDDEGWGSERSGMQSDNEGGTGMNSANSTASNTPVARRKRLRSVTPTSESNDHDPQGLAATESDDDSLLRSPLAKRKKLAAGRAGYSRLKEGITADELDRQSASTTRPSESRGSISSVPAYGSGYGVSVQENMWSRIGKINPGKSGSGSEGSGGGGMSDEGETDDAFGKIGRTNSRSKRKAGGGSWSDDEDGEMELGGDNENDYSRAVRKGMVGGDDDDESDSDDSSESGGMDDDDFLAGELDEEDWS